MPGTHQPSYPFAVALVVSALVMGQGTAAWADPPPDADTDADTDPEPTLTVKEVPAASVTPPPMDTDALPPVVKNLENHDVRIVGTFETPGGLQAYAGIAQQQPLAIYLTPDGKHVIIGTMMDEHGMDVTQPALTRATVGPWTAATWDALSESRWVADGNDDASHVIYMFTDPNCPFCNKFWKQARPWVERGDVQIRHILVGMLTQSSPGKAAAILQSDDPAQALQDHESAGIEAGIEPLEDISPDLQADLERNARLMEQLQIQGTPGILYFDQDGDLKIQRGAPLDSDLGQILDPR